MNPFSVFVGRLLRDLFSNRLILIGSMTASHVHFSEEEEEDKFNSIFASNGSTMNPRKTVGLVLVSTTRNRTERVTSVERLRAILVYTNIASKGHNGN